MRRRGNEILAMIGRLTFPDFYLGPSLVSCLVPFAEEIYFRFDKSIMPDAIWGKVKHTFAFLAIIFHVMGFHLRIYPVQTKLMTGGQLRDAELEALRIDPDLDLVSFERFVQPLRAT